MNMKHNKNTKRTNSNLLTRSVVLDQAVFHHAASVGSYAPEHPDVRAGYVLDDTRNCYLRIRSRRVGRLQHPFDFCFYNLLFKTADA